MEHYIDELLNGVGLSRANLLYSGGGHCYMLLPNTARVIETVKAWNLKFNNFLSDAFGIRLYLADGWTECTLKDLIKPSGETSIFRRASSAVARKKIQRYTLSAGIVGGGAEKNSTVYAGTGFAYERGRRGS